MLLRRAIKMLTWDNFKKEFENKSYSRYHHKMKKQEVLVLKQGEIPMLKYKKRLHDLSMFAPYYIPIEQYFIERLRDGFK